MRFHAVQLPLGFRERQTPAKWTTSCEISTSRDSSLCAGYLKMLASATLSTTIFEVRCLGQLLFGNCKKNSVLSSFSVGFFFFLPGGILVQAPYSPLVRTLSSFFFSFCSVCIESCAIGTPSQVPCGHALEIRVWSFDPSTLLLDFFLQ